MSLTKDQKDALELMESGYNVFLTGKAGTGKSYLLEYFISKSKERNKRILITASTGIAAINIGGATVHRTFKVPIDMMKIHNSQGRKNEVVSKADIIIIDEVSMLRMDVFDYVIRTINKNNPGCQIILTGDFLQLDPILRSGTEKDLYESYYGENKLFCFQSGFWDALDIKTIELKEVVRQQDDTELVKNLNLARVGDLSCIPYFNKFTNNTTIDEEEAIAICGTNRKASEINRAKTDEITNIPRIYNAIISGDVKYSDMPNDKQIILKKGCRVMTLINNPEEGYYNGSLGTVVSAELGSVVVELDNGREVRVNEYKWDIEEYQPSDNEEGFKLVTIGEYTQIPLKIAFAITIHKSQGQTFKNVIIHPESWSNGQLYVALSRCTDEEGLKLAYPIKERYLRANEDVINFYYKDEYYKEQEEVRKLARFSELKNISEGIDKIDIDGVVDEIPDKYKDKVNKLILILQELEESAEKVSETEEIKVVDDQVNFKEDEKVPEDIIEENNKIEEQLMKIEDEISDFLGEIYEEQFLDLGSEVSGSLEEIDNE